ncbi:MAG: sigma 54-interacting transcriptional regulator [Desulfuromonadales bacterium]|nr:sigma 54-interacting transcriptional regulator [Desulfuromonadales bacterium]
MTEQILIIDDEESIRITFETFLVDAGYRVLTAGTIEEAQTCLEQDPPDLIFLDIMLGQQSGLDLLKMIHDRRLNSPVVMITGAPEVETAAEAMRQGAFDYIPKPVRLETLLRVSKIALRHKKVLDERETFRSHLEAIFRSLREGLLLVDRSRHLCEANQPLLALVDLPEQIRGMTIDQLPGSVRPSFVSLFEQTLASGKGVASQRLETQDPAGKAATFDVSASPWFDRKGAIEGVVLSVRDQTRLDTLERSIGKRQNFEHIIGRSSAIQRVFDLIENLAEVDTTVLITGESGTGKELVAEALHFRSERRNGAIVKVNCAALPENLLESELFGHLKGSFTGAIKDKIGRFEQADGGTIFLDEIGDISPAMQVRLLRVLQNKEIEKVGGSQTVKIDVRIVAATHQDLAKKVRSGAFREDLYYRLRVVEVPLPPLRERRDDIPLLVEHFIDKFNTRFKHRIEGATEQAMNVLLSYAWPGNIRELENAIERAFVLCRLPLIDKPHLPAEVLHDTGHTFGEPETDREQLLAALEKSAWNKSKAARLLGVSRRTIYRRMEELAITAP